MSSPTTQDLENAIRAILDGAQLEGITQRLLRQQLEEKFGQVLTEQKATIKELTIKVLGEKSEEGREMAEEEVKANGGGAVKKEEEEEEEDEGSDDEEEGDEEGVKDESASEDEKPLKKKASGFNKELEWSDVMAEFLGSKMCSRPQVTKKLWAYIKEHNLQKPTDRRVILCDEKLQKLFNCKSVNMFKMTKGVNKHTRLKDDFEPSSEEEGEEQEDDDDEEDSGPRSKPAASKKRKSSPAAAKTATVKAPAKKKAKKAGRGEGGERKKASFPDEKLSEELQVIVGKSAAPRNEVVKMLWQYIKEHDLQNPADKREILCDGRLKSIFGQDRVNGFGMNKLLKPHILGRA